MSLRELGIGPGDEVIVPVLTFVASVNPIVYMGAIPVFVDVDPLTWNMDPEQVKKAVTKKTKAILPVHLYGNPCAMDEIMAIAEEKGLKIVEDATESLGARFKGQYTGTFGDFGCFSFNGNKIITTGGGGLIVGKNENDLEHIHFLINQAKSGEDHPEIGFNYRMTNLEAAIGLAQFEQFTDFLNKKKMIHKIYEEELGLDFQKACPQADSSCWLTCVLLPENISAARCLEELSRRQIPVRRIFKPVVEHAPYSNHKNRKFPNAYSIYERGLCLPSSTLNSADDIRYAASVFKEVIKHG
jgi:perosamine synthetase